MNSKLKIGKYELGSRLIVGSGKYDSFEMTKEATLASGSELITVAVRRLNITDPDKENLRDTFAGTNVKFLPNSAGCELLKRRSLLLDLLVKQPELILLSLKLSVILKKHFTLMF